MTEELILDPPTEAEIELINAFPGEMSNTTTTLRLIRFEEKVCL